MTATQKAVIFGNDLKTRQSFAIIFYVKLVLMELRQCLVKFLEKALPELLAVGITEQEGYGGSGNGLPWQPLMGADSVNGFHKVNAMRWATGWLTAQQAVPSIASIQTRHLSPDSAARACAAPA